MKNELIRELEKQSFITTETRKISGAWDNIVEPFRYVTVTETNFSLEKFAELILIEVTDILSTYRGKMVFEDGAEYNYEHPIIAIRKHFGVEE